MNIPHHASISVSAEQAAWGFDFHCYQMNNARTYRLGEHAHLRMYLYAASPSELADLGRALLDAAGEWENDERDAALSKAVI